MCGLAGVVNTHITNKEYEAFKKLLMISHWRGEDATGVIWAHDYWEKAQRKIGINYLKDEFASPEFLFRHRKTFDVEFDKRKPKAVMGHCRWATVGKLERKNAHPFNNKWLIGMHNGTINGPFENSKKFDTDSEALLYNIGEKGLVEALDPLKYRAPAYALTWIDKGDNTLNFFRNDARPLWFARNSSGLVAWASEREFLDIALSRERVAMDLVYSLKPHMLMKFRLDEAGCTDIKNVEWTDHTEALRIKVYSSGTTFPALERVNKSEEKVESEIDNDSEPEPLIYILNEPVTKSEYIDKLKHGCSWCKWKLDWNTRGSASWINEREYICSMCQKQEGVTEYVKEQQAEYWAEIRQQFSSKHPNGNFVPQRQLALVKKEVLNDPPFDKDTDEDAWPGEAGVSVH